jgi:hypothetical protein
MTGLDDDVVTVLVEPGWDTREEVGPGIFLLHYPNDVRRIEHTCTRLDHPGSTIVCSPHLSAEHRLTGGLGHATVEPSIACGRCGLHGWIRDGKWVTA